MKASKKAASKLTKEDIDLVKEFFYKQFQIILLKTIKTEKEKLDEAKKVKLEKAEQLETQQRIKEAEQDLDTIELLLTTYYPAVTIDFSTDTITISKEKLKLIDYFNTHTINLELLGAVYKDAIKIIEDFIVKCQTNPIISTFKKPEAIVNQMLSSKNRQFEIPFDSINTTIQQQLYNDNITAQKIETGLILTAGEHKLTTALSRLLHENSNTQPGGTN